MKSKTTFKDCAVSAESVPDTVRRRCELVVRDMDRMKALTDAFQEPGIWFGETGGTLPALVTKETADRASSELKCIQDALDAVPEVYREGIMLNIKFKTAFSDIAHPNTWKKWKKVFVHELARNLHLI